MGDGVVRIALIGNVPPQTDAVLDFLDTTDHLVWHVKSKHWYPGIAHFGPDLIIVAGWRWLVPPEVLRIAPTVGFHSAKLPEYPGRAPVPWTLLRGDDHAENTMLYLDEGVDSGDIIDSRRMALAPDMTPSVVYEFMARSAVEMLTDHLDGLLSGTAPRKPQDTAQRGPLTTTDGWSLWHERQRLGAGHG